MSITEILIKKRLILFHEGRNVGRQTVNYSGVTLVLQQQCLAIAKAFCLDWTAIDGWLKPNDQYIFLK